MALPKHVQFYLKMHFHQEMNYAQEITGSTAYMGFYFDFLFIHRESHWIFSMCLIVPAHYDPGVCSASNRADYLENVGFLTSH
jgi:hypothetical protein